MALIKEIMPEGMHQQFEGEDGRLAFGYIANGNRVDVETDRSGQQVSAMLSPAKPRRSTAAISRPAEALLMEAPAQTASHPSTTTADPPSPQRAADAAQAEERVQDLLRRLVDSSSSDLHMRVGLPPMYRTHGELIRQEGKSTLSREDIESMILSIMPERNRSEFAETNDTDFAYEIVDVARFRVNALRDRMGPAAVFRVIPTDILTADDLNLSPEVQKLCYLTKGLVVVTGPTGSTLSSERSTQRRPSAPSIGSSTSSRRPAGPDPRHAI